MNGYWASAVLDMYAKCGRSGSIYMWSLIPCVMENIIYCWFCESR